MLHLLVNGVIAVATPRETVEHVFILIQKLATYGFDNIALALISDYLTNSNLKTFYLNG